MHWHALSLQQYGVVWLGARRHFYIQYPVVQRLDLEFSSPYGVETANCFVSVEIISPAGIAIRVQHGHSAQQIPTFEIFVGVISQALVLEYSTILHARGYLQVHYLVPARWQSHTDGLFRGVIDFLDAQRYPDVDRLIGARLVPIHSCLPPAGSESKSREEVLEYVLAEEVTAVVVETRTRSTGPLSIAPDGIILLSLFWVFEGVVGLVDLLELLFIPSPVGVMFFCQALECFLYVLVRWLIMFVFVVCFFAFFVFCTLCL